MKKDKAIRTAELADKLTRATVELLQTEEPDVINGAMCCVMARVIQATADSLVDQVMLANKNAEFVIKVVVQDR